MDKLLASISVVLYCSLSFSLNLDSDLSGKWLIKGTDDSFITNIFSTKTDKMASDLIDNDALKNSVLYDIEADGEWFEHHFAMCIVKDLNDNNHIFWFRNRELVDVESNTIMRIEGNKIFLGPDLEATKEIAVMNKIDN